MSIEAVVPFKPVNPKSRLSAVLSTAERELFAEAMLTDVILSLKEAGCNPFILSTVPLHCAYAKVNVSAEELNPALNGLIASSYRSVAHHHGRLTAGYTRCRPADDFHHQ